MNNLLVDYLRDYIDVIVTGDGRDRFLNLCKNNNILLWNIRFDGNATIHFRAYRDDFKLIRRYVKLAGVGCRLTGKTGIRADMFRYRKRMGFLIGCIVGFLLVRLCGNYLWTIEIKGNFYYQDSIIESELNSLGIYEGMRCADIRTDELEWSLRRSLSKVNWVSVANKGTVLEVNVKECDDVIDNVADEGVCDYVAEADGIVRHMVTRRGTPLVTVGDEVKKGQVLIKGEVVVKTQEGAETVQEVAADGDVGIETMIDYYDLVYNDRMDVYYSDYAVYGLQLMFNNRLYGLMTFDDARGYHHIKYRTNLNKLFNIRLPFYVELTESRRYRYVSRECSYQEIEAELYNNYSNYLKNLQNSIQILEDNVKIYRYNGYNCMEGKLKVVGPFYNRV